MNNVKGYKVYSLKDGYTDSFIFLPAAGCYLDKKMEVGSVCEYWSSGLVNNYERRQNTDSYAISNYGQSIIQTQRWIGLPIRAVKKKY